MNYDFVAIGDIVTDAFIVLREAEVHEKMDHANKEICMSWGTKIPYEKVIVCPAVGNAANAAVSAARLGLKTAFVTNQGDDDVGKTHLASLKKDGVAEEYVKVHAGMSSNYHYVLSFKGERTILIKHEHYPREIPEMESPQWVYLSSFGENSEEFLGKLRGYLESHPGVRVAFQPGVFEVRQDSEQLSWLYKRSEIFVCNIEEAQQILKTTVRDPKELAQGIALLGPKIVCLTDGPDGAYAYSAEGGSASGGRGSLWFIPPYPDPKEPVDRTGAGDAFASTFTIAIALGKSVPEALSWGPINSMSVVQFYGAQEGLLSREKLEAYLKDAPAGYEPKVI